MTIAEAIARADELKPNVFASNIKKDWLSDLDSTVMIEIIRTHEGDEEYSGFAGYDDGTDGSTVLLAPEPYSDMYVLWLISKIDYYNGEFDRYSNTAAEFNAKYRDFADFWNRTHTPKGVHYMNYYGGRK